MKKFHLISLLLMCPTVLLGQLAVSFNGDTYVGKSIYLESPGSFLGTTSYSVPLTFRVNNLLAGYTGYSDSNVSFGSGALSSLWGGPHNAGIYNTAIGHYALGSNTTGWYNTANGYEALYSNTTGYGNTANGYYTLRANTTSNYHVAIGFYALQSNTAGYGCTAIGSRALYYNTGSYNTAIGYYANHGSYNQTYTNTTAIGYDATVSADNQVRIGNSSITSIGGYAGWTNVSDGRIKKNIQANVPGLAFINRLQPVTYNLNLDAADDLQQSDDPQINHIRDSLRMSLTPEEQEILTKAKANKEKQVYSGFIAQDVEKTAKSIGYAFSGVDAPENDKGTYGLRYADFVVPLVKAVQELSEQNNRLQEQVNELTAKLNELTNAQKSPIAGAIDESEPAKDVIGHQIERKPLLINR